MTKMEFCSDSIAFCAVVEKGSFTAAADSLNLSKGAVSKFVSRLEGRLGTRLLNRSTRRLSTTETGKAFYFRASRALAELDKAEQELSDQTGQPHGQLRISAPTFYGSEILSKYLVDFHRLYPEVGVNLVLENRFVDLVEERFDLALRIAAPKDSSLIMRKLADIPMAICASPAYLEKYGRPQAPQELRTHSCLIYTVVSRPHDWLFKQKNGNRLRVPVNGNFKSNDDHVIRQAAVDGLGILLMPKLFVENLLASGELVQLFSDNAMQGVTLAIAYPSRQGMPANARAFVDFMVRTVG
jgi:DNA-binding transcriptional LysR family regulator